MEDLKSILLGEAISDAATEPGEFRSFPEPDGAPEIRRLYGVVAILMESACPPATFCDLRTEVLAQELTSKERRQVGSALIGLLGSDILSIAPVDRTLEYHPPQTQHYVDCLQML